MPQLDFVSFHYTLNTLSPTYLFVYAVVTLFCFKPIFKEFFFFFGHPAYSNLRAMLLLPLCSEKIIFSKFYHPKVSLKQAQAKQRGRWDTYQFIPKLGHLMELRIRKPEWVVRWRGDSGMYLDY